MRSKQGRFAGESGEICGSALLTTPLSGEWPQCQRIAKADGDKRADIHPHTHARTATYNSFMSIFSGCSVYPGKGGRKQLDSDPQTGSILPSGRALLSSLAYVPPLTLYVILPSTVAYFLPIHFLIGAAARRCCCAQSTEASAEQGTPKKGWFARGVTVGSV